MPGFAVEFAGCVFGSRIGREKVADSKISGYMRTGLKNNGEQTGYAAFHN